MTSRRLKSYNSYIEHLTKNYPQYTISNYTNKKEKCTHHCSIHSITFEASPYLITSSNLESHLSTHCPECVIDFKTNLYKSLLPNNIELLTKFTGSHNNADFKCLNCNHIWTTEAGNGNKKYGCPKCANINRRLSSDEFLKRVNKNNPSVTVLGSFNTTNDKIQCRCKCGNENWYPNAGTIMGGSSKKCPKCCGHLTEEEYIEKLPKELSLISKFTAVTKKTKHRCNVCSFEWETVPAFILNGSGCPICSANKTHFDMYKDKKTTLYYISINNVYKIGLSQSTISKRFRKELKAGHELNIIDSWEFTDGYEAYKLEQNIIHTFQQYKYTGDKVLVNGGDTELFTEDIYEYIHPMIELTILES